MNKKIKRIIQKIIFCLLLSVSLLCPHSLSVQAASPPSSASVMSDHIAWKYKTENGHKYKRLFNYNTNKWIGDWILIY